MKAWFDRLPLPWRHWRITDVVDSAAELPTRLPYRGLLWWYSPTLSPVGLSSIVRAHEDIA